MDGSSSVNGNCLGKGVLFYQRSRKCHCKGVWQISRLGDKFRRQHTVQVKQWVSMRWIISLSWKTWLPIEWTINQINFFVKQGPVRPINGMAVRAYTGALRTGLSCVSNEFAFLLASVFDRSGKLRWFPLLNYDAWFFLVILNVYDDPDWRHSRWNLRRIRGLLLLIFMDSVVGLVSDWFWKANVLGRKILSKRLPGLSKRGNSPESQDKSRPLLDLSTNLSFLFPSSSAGGIRFIPRSDSQDYHRHPSPERLHHVVKIGRNGLPLFVRWDPGKKHISIFIELCSSWHFFCLNRKLKSNP